jgi:hypothetical protein
MYVQLCPIERSVHHSAHALQDEHISYAATAEPPSPLAHPKPPTPTPAPTPKPACKVTADSGLVRTGYCTAKFPAVAAIANKKDPDGCEEDCIANGIAFVANTGQCSVYGGSNAAIIDYSCVKGDICVVCDAKVRGTHGMRML